MLPSLHYMFYWGCSWWRPVKLFLVCCPLLSSPYSRPVGIIGYFLYFPISVIHWFLFGFTESLLFQHSSWCSLLLLPLLWRCPLKYFDCALLFAPFQCFSLFSSSSLTVNRWFSFFSLSVSSSFVGVFFPLQSQCMYIPIHLSFSSFNGAWLHCILCRLLYLLPIHCRCCSCWQAISSNKPTKSAHVIGSFKPIVLSLFSFRHVSGTETVLDTALWYSWCLGFGGTCWSFG